MCERDLKDMNATDKPNLQDLRVSYELGELDEETSPCNPFVLFREWLDDALKKKVPEPNAMTLATVGMDGFPTTRTVLLKGLDDRGFHFFTSYMSRKGRELDRNSRASICFHWNGTQRQVTARGLVWKLPHEEAAAYFESRPRDHKIGAWASKQSQVIPGRAWLEMRAKEVEARFDEGEIPCPENWGGYALMPDEIEFWQGRPSRLHDRIRYLREGNHWERLRLGP